MYIIHIAHCRPDVEDIIKIRCLILTFIRKLVCKNPALKNAINQLESKDDELQSLLNFLTTVQEVLYLYSIPATTIFR